MAAFVSSLFSYNRENFRFNAQMHQRAAYQQQKMRVAQALLYREDVRDLFGLAIGKMDNYTIVNILFLGITGELFYKGRMAGGSPEWIVWAYSVSICTAFYFLMLSVWLSLHASISAQSFMTRFLTQFVRLPVPSAEEIDAVAARLEDYEGSSMADIFRVPGMEARTKFEAGSGGTLPTAGLTHGGSEHSSENGATRPSPDSDLEMRWWMYVKHFRYFNRVHGLWKNQEAYTRVALVLGLNQLLNALTYFGLMYYVLYSSHLWTGLAITSLSSCVAYVHLKISIMFMSELESWLILLCSTVPTMLMMINSVVYSLGSTSSSEYFQSWVKSGWPNVLPLFTSICHLVFVAWFLHVTLSPNVNGLPVRVSTAFKIKLYGSSPESVLDIQEPTVESRLRRQSVYERAETKLMGQSPSDGRRGSDTGHNSEELVDRLFNDVGAQQDLRDAAKTVGQIEELLRIRNVFFAVIHEEANSSGRSGEIQSGDQVAEFLGHCARSYEKNAAFVRHLLIENETSSLVVDSATGQIMSARLDPSSAGISIPLESFDREELASIREESGTNPALFEEVVTSLVYKLDQLVKDIMYLTEYGGSESPVPRGLDVGGFSPSGESRLTGVRRGLTSAVAPGGVYARAFTRQGGEGFNSPRHAGATAGTGTATGIGAGRRHSGHQNYDANRAREILLSSSIPAWPKHFFTTGCLIAVAGWFMSVVMNIVQSSGVEFG